MRGTAACLASFVIAPCSALLLASTTSHTIWTLLESFAILLIGSSLPFICMMNCETIAARERSIIRLIAQMSARENILYIADKKRMLNLKVMRMAYTTMLPFNDAMDMLVAAFGAVRKPTNFGHVIELFIVVNVVVISLVHTMIWLGNAISPMAKSAKG